MSRTDFRRVRTILLLVEERAFRCPAPTPIWFFIGVCGDAGSAGGQFAEHIAHGPGLAPEQGAEQRGDSCEEALGSRLVPAEGEPGHEFWLTGSNTGSNPLIRGDDLGLDRASGQVG